MEKQRHKLPTIQLFLHCKFRPPHGHCTIKLRLRANRLKLTKRHNYDWPTLQKNHQISEEFQISLKNRFSLLQEESEPNTADQGYNKFVMACEKGAEENIPLKPKPKTKVR